MNSPIAAELLDAQRPPLGLAQLALAQMAPSLVDDGAASEALWLAALSAQSAGLDLVSGLAAWEQAPPAADQAVHRLAHLLDLSAIECVAVALALAVDTDPVAARAVAWLQAPLRDMHPSAGLVAALFSATGTPPALGLAQLMDGAALACGLLQLDSQGRTLPDACLSLPMAVVLAASGASGGWPGVTLDKADQMPAQLPASIQRQAERWANALADGPSPGLVIQSPHAPESRLGAASIARCLGKRAAFIVGSPPPGLVPWLLLHDALPVFCAELAPGERQGLPPLVGHDAPALVASGTDGGWTLDGESLPVWRMPLPSSAERSALWRQGRVDAELALTLGQQHRHSAERIGQLCRAAELRRIQLGEPSLSPAHIHHAARHGRSELGTLAENLPDDVPDAALVLPPPLRDELERLLLRCRRRDGLAQGLGVAAQTRYRPGVRALMVGPSGTGKTLAAGWIATRLGLPLYRVDLAAVSSKYIGETEKNLAELFARAEHAEVVLLFDEADALFGKRTEVKDANDRHANQQTNYLLQRIESFDGIVLMTSNSRSRFDSAYTRRLDAILDFPTPGPAERRDLWLAHLGDAHCLSTTELNRLAAGCDLCGGHIRNVTLAARASAPDRPIGADDLAPVLAAEYRKLGKSMPAGLFVVGA